MKQTFYFLTLILFSLTRCAADNTGSTVSIDKEYIETLDTIPGQIHPAVKHIFYNLPLEKSRKDLREVIVNDQRFISTDTAFNNYKPHSFFKGITADKGLIKSNPDSIKIMLVSGNTELTTEKGRPSDFKDVMILSCTYFYSDKGSIEMEYQRLLNMLHPIFYDSSSMKNETAYAKGTQKTIEQFFVSFEPYYDVSISESTKIPANGSKRVFELNIGFRKEDK